MHQGWQVFKLNYEDNNTKYLITHVYSTEPPIPDITTTDASYINQFIVTPYDRSKDFGARRPFGFKVGYSYNVKHGNMCKYPINKPNISIDAKNIKIIYTPNVIYDIIFFTFIFI